MSHFLRTPMCSLYHILSSFCHFVYNSLVSCIFVQQVFIVCRQMDFGEKDLCFVLGQLARPPSDSSSAACCFILKKNNKKTHAHRNYNKTRVKTNLYIVSQS